MGDTPSPSERARRACRFSLPLLGLILVSFFLPTVRSCEGIESPRDVIGHGEAPWDRLLLTAVHAPYIVTLLFFVALLYGVIGGSPPARLPRRIVSGALLLCGLPAVLLALGFDCDYRSSRPPEFAEMFEGLFGLPVNPELRFVTTVNVHSSWPMLPAMISSCLGVVSLVRARRDEGWIRWRKLLGSYLLFVSWYMLEIGSALLSPGSAGIGARLILLAFVGLSTLWFTSAADRENERPRGARSVVEAQARRRRATRVLFAAVAVALVAFSVRHVLQRRRAARNESLLEIATLSKSPLESMLLLQEMDGATPLELDPPTRAQVAGRHVPWATHRGGDADGPVVGVRFSPDDAWVMALFDRGNVKFFDSDGVGKPVPLGCMGVTRVGFLGNGSVIGVSTGDGALVYRIGDFAHPAPFPGSFLDIDKTMTMLAAISQGIVVVTNTRGDVTKPIVAVRSRATAVTFTGDGENVLIEGPGARRAIIPIRGEAAGKTKPFPIPPALQISGRSILDRVVVSDDVRLAASFWERTVLVWRLDALGDPLLLHVADGDAEIARVDLYGSIVAAALSDHTVGFFSLLEAPSSFRPLGRHDASINDIELEHPDGSSASGSEPTRFVSASSDGTARVWSLAWPREPVVLDTGGEPLVSAIFNHQRTRIVTVSEGGTISVWKLERPLVPQTWAGLIDFARTSTTACLSPDQRLRFLGETGATAVRDYEACEESFSREAHLDMSTAGP